MIVADTGALIALVDRDDQHHQALLEVFEQDDDWILPWAVLPEVDFILSNHVGAAAARAFVRDIANGAYALEWNEPADLARVDELCTRYKSLSLGLVDAVVIATAERLRPDAIATVDLRDFGAVKIKGSPKLYPRDLA